MFIVPRKSYQLEKVSIQVNLLIVQKALRDLEGNMIDTDPTASQSVFFLPNPKNKLP